MERQETEHAYVPLGTGDRYATNNVSVSMAPTSATDMVHVAAMTAAAAVSLARTSGFGPDRHVPSAIHFMPLPTARCAAQPIAAAHLAVDGPLATTDVAAPASPKKVILKNCTVGPRANCRRVPAYPNARPASGDQTAINCALEQASLYPAMPAPGAENVHMSVVAAVMLGSAELRASTPALRLRSMDGFLPAQVVVCAPAPTTASAFSAMQGPAARSPVRSGATTPAVAHAVEPAAPMAAASATSTTLVLLASMNASVFPQEPHVPSPVDASRVVDVSASAMQVSAFSMALRAPFASKVITDLTAGNRAPGTPLLLVRRSVCASCSMHRKTAR